MKESELLLESLLENMAGFAIISFEFIGVRIIIWSGFKGSTKWIRHAGETKIYHAKRLAMGLKFKMENEILRTVMVREWQKIGIVARILLVADPLGD